MDTPIHPSVPDSHAGQNVGGGGAGPSSFEVPPVRVCSASVGLEFGALTARHVSTLISMNVATSSRVEVGIRELKNNLSRYLEQVERGVEVVVTDRGRPVARLNGVDSMEGDRLAKLIDAGLVRPPASRVRQRPVPLAAGGSVSELVTEQRR